MRGFRIFAEYELHGYLENRLQEARNEVKSKSKRSMLGLDESQFIQHLVQKYKVESLMLDFEAVFCTAREERILASEFPSFQFNIQEGKAYLKQVITYHLPFIGSEKLLCFQPSTSVYWTTDVWLAEGCVCLDIVDFYGDVERIKQEGDRTLANTKSNWEYLVNDIAKFNRGLEASIVGAIKQRREELNRQMEVLAGLGKPIRSNEATSHEQSRISSAVISGGARSAEKKRQEPEDVIRRSGVILPGAPLSNTLILLEALKDAGDNILWWDSYLDSDCFTFIEEILGRTDDSRIRILAGESNVNKLFRQCVIDCKHQFNNATVRFQARLASKDVWQRAYHDRYIVGNVTSYVGPSIQQVKKGKLSSYTQLPEDQAKHIARELEKLWARCTDL